MQTVRGILGPHHYGAALRAWCAAQNKLMEPPNKTWSDIIRQANLTPDILKQTEVLKNVQNILATNVSVCSSLGPPFASQMSHIYIDMLTVYRRAAAPRAEPYRLVGVRLAVCCIVPYFAPGLAS